jgi:hypothetical protein
MFVFADLAHGGDVGGAFDYFWQWGRCTPGRVVRLLAHVTKLPLLEAHPTAGCNVRLPALVPGCL